MLHIHSFKVGKHLPRNLPPSNHLSLQPLSSYSLLLRHTFEAFFASQCSFITRPLFLVGGSSILANSAFLSPLEYEPRVDIACTRALWSLATRLKGQHPQKAFISLMKTPKVGCVDSDDTYHKACNWSDGAAVLFPIRAAPASLHDTTCIGLRHSVPAIMPHSADEAHTTWLRRYLRLPQIGSVPGVLVLPLPKYEW